MKLISVEDADYVRLDAAQALEHDDFCTQLRPDAINRICTPQPSENTAPTEISTAFPQAESFPQVFAQRNVLEPQGFTGFPQEAEREIFSLKDDRSSTNKVSTFDLFWTAYPRKTGKQNALKVWTKAKFGQDTLDAILTALLWQTKHDDWTRENGRYIPMPETYLRGERWKDEPQTAGKAPSSPVDARLDIASEADRQARAGCPHEPRCGGLVGCRVKIMVSLAAARKGM